MKTTDYLTQLKSLLENGLVLINDALDGDDDDALESGAAGSGRFKRRTGMKGPDLVSEAAQRATREAQRTGTAAEHLRAADLNDIAAEEMRRVGQDDRASEHAEKSVAHRHIAKILQSTDLNASAAREFEGRPTVPHPKGSDSNFNDKTAYGSERERNLEEAGGPVTPDADGFLKCPDCGEIFKPNQSVTGGNTVVCPGCSGTFRLHDWKEHDTRALASRREAVRRQNTWEKAS